MTFVDQWDIIAFRKDEGEEPRKKAGPQRRRGVKWIKGDESMIPVVIEQTSRGERSYDIYSRLLKDRLSW